MKDLKNVYLEHSQRLTDNVTTLKTIDLWYDQVSFMADEHPFKAPACFISYRTVTPPVNVGEKIQNLQMQADVYFFYETFADTSKGSKRQAHALAFLDTLNEINACFHGSSGTYFSEMKRTGFNPVETGGAGMLYLQRYEFTMVDDSAQVLFENMQFENMQVNVTKEAPAEPQNTSNLYESIPS